MDLFTIAVGIIGSRDLTEEILSEVMTILATLAPGEASALESVKKQLESTIGIFMEPGAGLTAAKHAPWVEDIKASTEWIYWDSYVKQLKSDNFPSRVIRTLDEDTDNILTECGNPSSDSGWRLQGLVMGDVQSGKTASYCGLICKAADSGYRVIVLLTGTIEELRSQSQERLDEGFVGRDSRDLLTGKAGGKPFGAGRFRTRIPNVLTSIDSDFLTGNRDALKGVPLENLNEPVLLVMKKNRAALESLRNYLKSQVPKGSDRLRMPLLLIDDEADNASVNAGRDNNPRTINRLIRELLDSFHKVSYVAYTATPFANVFINPDQEAGDLFPTSFVYSLNTPTSYIGASSIFLDGGGHESQLVTINDAAAIFPEKHKKDLEVQRIPKSLEDAIGVFLISCAVRDLRGEPLKHRSMLINVSRFTNVQHRLAEIVKGYLFEWVEEIKQYMADDDLWIRHPQLLRLHDLFKEHYSSCGAAWDDVRLSLYSATASVKVLTINQQTGQDERLNYRIYKGNEKGRRVIAIGGLTLSRGLTLEGLCVSYFYRNSKAYDTLLQMGRWFGYRPRYADLCRIWMTTELQTWFAHIAEVVIELRDDIRRMHANKRKPIHFGIRVKSHPGALLVTAANKMRNSSEVDVDLSFSMVAIETPILPKSKEENLANANATSTFLRSLGHPMRLGGRSDDGGRLFWGKVSAKKVADFLSQMHISPLNSAFLSDQRTGDSPLISFIRDNNLGSLSTWDICVPQGKGATASEIQIEGPDGRQVPIRKRRRQFEGSHSNSVSYLKVNKQRVGEIADEKVGLTEEQITTAENSWRSAHANEKKKTPPGRAYRSFRERPLLTISAIEPAGAEPPSDRILDSSSIEPNLLVAVSLVFPEYEETTTTPVRYRLNKVYMQQLGLLEEDDENDDQD